mmetsp:Transcript_72433/g.202202  ORF Transcript_72433/g.202202 Transcript_72433/m.202202 type:complete len:293 (-) Transcript_72433:1393-2271(-)
MNCWGPGWRSLANSATRSEEGERERERREREGSRGGKAAAARVERRRRARCVCTPSHRDLAPESDHVRRVRCLWVLGDEYLRVRQVVHRAVVPVAPRPDRQEALVLWVAEARHASHEQTEKDLPAAVRQDPAEPPVVDVLGVPGEVRSRAPHGAGAAAAQQRLEASHWIAHDLLDCAGAVEGPPRVQAGPEGQALLLEAALHGPGVHLAAVVLGRVLDAVYSGDLDVLPHPGVHVVVCTRHLRLGLEDRAHRVPLLATRRDLECHALAGALRVAVPEPAQVRHGESQPTLGL